MLFFAESAGRDEALALLATVRRRSEKRVATLRSIMPAARSNVTGVMFIRC